MSSSDKKLLRAVIRRVHPDLFNTLPFERSHNSDNLKLLNQYIDDLASEFNPTPVTVSFWVRGELQLELIDAKLSGSLAGLYHAFGEISDEELREWEALHPAGLSPDDTNFLQWLHETVQDAVACADEHEQRKKLVRELKATIEFKYSLQVCFVPHGAAWSSLWGIIRTLPLPSGSLSSRSAVSRRGIRNSNQERQQAQTLLSKAAMQAVRVGNTYSSTTIDLSRQLECLRVFEAFLVDAGDTYDGLAFHLYHPWNAPSQTYAWTDDEGEDTEPRMESAVMNAHVAADGVMHVIADRRTLRSQVDSLNVQHARVLAGVNNFWGRRQRDLTPQLCDVLAVQNVWCDNRSSESQEAFVLWAGRVLHASGTFAEVLESRTFNFSVLIHSDEASPLIDYMATSSVLQVRSDCSVQVLLEFLCSETADEADVTAVNLYRQEDEEAAILEEVKRAFGAKHVIRVCSSEHKNSVLSAARRLLDHSDQIRAQVNLEGASIAIDDCYQIWESGFISIPHTFDVTDLNKTLPKLLLPGSSGMPPVHDHDEDAEAHGHNGDGFGAEDTVYDMPSHGASAHGYGNGSGGRYSTGATRSGQYSGREYTAARSFGDPRRGEEFRGVTGPRRLRHARVLVQPWLLNRAGIGRR